jgi:hypothetical protein
MMPPKHLIALLLATILAFGLTIYTFLLYDERGEKLQLACPSPEQVDYNCFFDVCLNKGSGDYLPPRCCDPVDVSWCEWHELRFT